MLIRRRTTWCATALLVGGSVTCLLLFIVVPMMRSRSAIASWVKLTALPQGATDGTSQQVLRRAALGPPISVTDEYGNVSTNPTAYGFVDSEGNIVIEPRLFWADEVFVQGRAVAADQRGTGFIDQSGAWISSDRFEGAYRFSSGLARVWSTEGDLSPRKYGFVNLSGQVVVPVEWDFATDYNNGYALVGRDTLVSRFLGWAMAVGGIEGIDVPRDLRYKLIDDSGSPVTPP